MNVNVLSSGAVCAFLLVGCGGGSSTPSSDSGSEPTVLTGVFVDSPVEGATFATETQSGVTNASGEFSYLAAEQVTFSIGATQFPAVAAAARVSPVDMAASSSSPTATTTNIARLLQSLDRDGNPDNGITIPETAAAVSATINFDVSTEDFENNPAVINLVANSGSVNTTLISAEDANSHLASTLGNGGSSNVVTEGQIVTLEQFTATIVGTTAILLNDDGSRDESTRLFTSLEDMKITGTFRGENTNLDWYWEDEYYCRSGQSGAVTVELDCQVVTMSDGVATYTANRGAGESNSYFIDRLSVGDGNESSDNVILDLRDTTWLESNETGCDGLANSVRVEFSQTGLSAFISRAEDRGAGCVRENPNFPETTYAEANNTSAFMLTCGGDGQCTFDELNREVLVPVGDPRNDCTQDGEPVEVNHRISHVSGSDTITIFNCNPEDADIYVRQ